MNLRVLEIRLPMSVDNWLNKAELAHYENKLIPALELQRPSLHIKAISLTREHPRHIDVPCSLEDDGAGLLSTGMLAVGMWNACAGAKLGVQRIVDTPRLPCL